MLSWTYRKPFHLNDFLLFQVILLIVVQCAAIIKKIIECKECSNLHIIIYFKNISWFLKYVDLNFKQNLKAV